MSMDIARTISRRRAPLSAPDRRAATRGRPYRALLAFAIVGLALSLGACGKKGDPVLPDGAKDQYPHTYPQSTAPQTGVFSN